MTKKSLALISAILLSYVSSVPGQQPDSIKSESRVHDIKLILPALTLAGVPFTIEIHALNSDGNLSKTYNGEANLQGVAIESGDSEAQTLTTIPFDAGSATIEKVVFKNSGKKPIRIMTSSREAETTVRVIPGILSLLPPLFAIALAFITRQVLIALFSGIWLGALFIHGYNPLSGFLRTIDTYFVKSLADPDHAAILIFSLTLGGMVGIISKSGGMQGIVKKLSRYANNRRGGQLATWAMGVLIFFDDYANTLVVGNTMRPFTDRLKISREKLSYIVDSTAAPVASVAIISTWVGFQIGLIDDAFNTINFSQNAYGVFLQSIPHQTYSILTLIFVFMIGLSLRDFGPMLKAETRASSSGKVLRDGAQPIADSGTLEMAAEENTPIRWYNGLLPIIVVIFVTIIGLYFSGRDALGEATDGASLGTIFGEANSFAALMWASFAGLFIAATLALSQKILTLRQTLDAVVNGYKSMLLAAMILIMAWAIGNICKDLKTADYVIHLTKDILSPHFIPFATFVVAAFISFSTGSSWTTMTILTPIVVPIAVALPSEAALSTGLSHEILIGTIGAILSGSVLGDHCSPISDTTILSSMASAADHVDHVRTQMPYALFVGGVAILIGYLPNGWGFNAFLSLVMGVAILGGFLFFFGKRSTPGQKV